MKILIVLGLLFFGSNAFAFDYYKGQVKRIKDNTISILINGSVKKVTINKETVCYQKGYIGHCKDINRGDLVRIECKNDICFKVIQESEIK